MNRRSLMSWFAWMTVACLAVVGCTPTTPPTASAPSPTQTSAEEITLTIAAAASLQDALNAIQIEYEAANPEITLVYNFGSSGALQQQIEQGAPVDVFLSAAPKQIDALDAKGLLLADSRKDLLKNSIVLVTPLNKQDVTRFEDLAKDTVTKLSIGDPASVPAGQYGKETLESLGLYSTVEPKIVFAKDVRQVLSYVETGNVDAGLVYASDAKISDQVQVVATAAEETHSPIIYPGAVVADSPQPEAATAFLNFLTTDEAIAIFETYGFLSAQS